MVAVSEAGVILPQRQKYSRFLTFALIDLK